MEYLVFTMVIMAISGADGRVVEGRATVPTPPRGQQGSNPRPDGPPMDVVLSRKEKGEERVGVGGRGKYPGAPPHIRKKKREEKTSRPQRYLIGQMVKGERL
jgi:hypothetical protein